MRSRLRSGCAIPPLEIENPLSACLASFDFAQSDDFGAERAAIEIMATADGEARGVLQWIWFGFPDGTACENTPNRKSTWALRFHPFAEPLLIPTGDRVELDNQPDGRY